MMEKSMPTIYIGIGKSKLRNEVELQEVVFGVGHFRGHLGGKGDRRIG